jgi:Zn-dependent protease
VFFPLALLFGAGEIAYGMNILGSLTHFCMSLFILNAGLAVFNLIPAFPMDGGRILRALLAMKKGMGPATIIAARVGRWIAVIGGIAALVYGYFIAAFIALFIFFAGKQEELAARLRHGGFSFTGLDKGGVFRRRRTRSEFYENCSPMEGNEEDPFERLRSILEKRF